MKTKFTDETEKAGIVSDPITVAVKVNGELRDLNCPIEKSAKAESITAGSEEAFKILNHSCAHLLAAAVKRLYRDARFGVGPAIEEGFYYDIDPGEGKTITEDDLPTIEKEMKKISEENQKFSRTEVSGKEALEIFRDDPYKTELIGEVPEGETISIYTVGGYVDFCRGPHVPNTGMLKHFRLLSVAGAYWRGDSSRKQLQRIYGTCFPTEEELKKHLEILKEREARDHRRLGKELGLFMISEYGPGFPFWLPNGMILRRELENYWYRVNAREGYKFIQTPIILNKELWEISGHWKNYRENMYLTDIDGGDFVIKPMNCPGAMLVYRNGIRSHKDLPLRIGELGLVHRHEASGALNGLFRVRAFTQDDAHIFLGEDQIEAEVGSLIKLFDEIYSVFGLDYHIELSTRPEKKFIGSPETWDRAEAALESACRFAGHDFRFNPGDGAFYGPKLDFKLRDSMNRIWQCGTIQLDMNLPERFDLTYIGPDGEKKRPIMLHRAIFGSLERFIGILTEHFGGAFPTWIAPVQVRLIPVNKTYHLNYLKELDIRLVKAGIRTETDDRDEKLGYKIRDAQIKKIPYQVVCGNIETEKRLLTYRRYGSTEQTTVTIDAFIAMIGEEIRLMKRL